jgi:hypothetical protein
VTAVCRFYLRTEQPDGQRYELVDWGGTFSVCLEDVPAVGDLVHRPTVTLRVETRAWMIATRGSMDWPGNQDGPNVVPSVDLICTAAEGPFLDEAPTNEEDA